MGRRGRENWKHQCSGPHVGFGRRVYRDGSICFFWGSGQRRPWKRTVSAIVTGIAELGEAYSRIVLI